MMMQRNATKQKHAACEETLCERPQRTLPHNAALRKIKSYEQIAVRKGQIGEPESSEIMKRTTGLPPTGADVCGGARVATHSLAQSESLHQSLPSSSRRQRIMATSSMRSVQGVQSKSPPCNNGGSFGVKRGGEREEDLELL